MLGISDLKIGTNFVMDDAPYEVLEAKHVMLGRGKGHLEVRIRNLKTGSVLSRSFKPSDAFAEADLVRARAKFIYANRGKYVFAEADSPAKRFEFTEEQLGEDRFFLVPHLAVDVLRFDDEIIHIQLPPKVDVKVVNAPPSERGNTAQGGKKPVVCETGLKVQAPFFIETGEVIRVNTKTGEYVERVK